MYQLSISISETTHLHKECYEKWLPVETKLDTKCDN